jgi:hypothetical protein
MLSALTREACALTLSAAMMRPALLTSGTAIERNPSSSS